MPKVVPKMVLDLIDASIDVARKQQEQAESGGIVQPFDLTAADHSAALSGVIALADQLPPEMLAGLSPEDYAALTVNLAAIRNQLSTWQYADREMRHSTFGPVRGYSNLNPITGVRQMLSKCPNELPAVGPHGLDFIADERFRTILLRDINSTEQALGNNEYKAAVVLGGSVIEAILLWALGGDDGAALAAALRKLQDAGEMDTRLSADDLTARAWGLADFIKLAEKRRILDPTTVKVAEAAKGFRNLIHPGAEVRDQEPPTLEMARAATAALGFVLRDVAAWEARRNPSEGF